jgi:hypothetical protein
LTATRPRGCCSHPSCAAIRSARAAAELLSAERKRKLAGLLLGIRRPRPARIGGGVADRSPRSAREIGRGVRDWNDRTEAEDRALDLLEPGVRRGDLDARASRSTSASTGARRPSASRSCSTTSSRARARQSAPRPPRPRRALALEPGSPRADRLLDEIAEREWRAALDAGLAIATSPVHDQIEAWEVRWHGAARATTRALPSRENEGGDDAALARATAHYLEGDRARALDEFERIARGGDSAASRARQLLADPDVNPARSTRRRAATGRSARSAGSAAGAAEAAIPTPSEA